MVENIISLTNLHIAALVLSIFWVLLSIVVLKITFFPKKNVSEENTDPSKNTNKTETTSTKNKNQSNKKHVETKKTKNTENTKSSDKQASVEKEDIEVPEEKYAEKSKKSVEDQKPLLGTSLQGIKLPEGLTPNEKQESATSTYQIFTAAEGEALEYGTAFADELTRLGYTVEAVSHQEAKATRDGKSIFMRIEPKAGNAIYQGSSRFPTLPYDTIVLETWGEGERPEGI